VNRVETSLSLGRNSSGPYGHDESAVSKVKGSGKKQRVVGVDQKETFEALKYGSGSFPEEAAIFRSTQNRSHRKHAADL